MAESLGRRDKSEKLSNVSADNNRIRDNLEKFVRNTLKEGNMTSYQLSKLTDAHETTWDRFLKGEILMPSSKTVVKLADYKKVSLDEVVGRDLTKEIELEASKDTASKMPAFMSGLSPEVVQSVTQIREEAGKFRHKSTPSLKSFVEKERARRNNKPTERTR